MDEASSPKPTRALLRTALVNRYAQLRDRLASRLGSADLASEALHETWLRLQDGKDLAPVVNSDAYLYRAILNSAAKLGAADRRVLGTVDIDAILDVADDAPGPERIAAAKSELAALRRLLKRLTRRQRDIFLESFAGDATHADLAERHKISVRTVQDDLRKGFLLVALHMTENNGFASLPVRVSRK